MKKMAMGVVLVAGLLMSPGLRAQGKDAGPVTAHAPTQDAGPVMLPAPRPPEHFYKLNLVVEEVDDAGKVTNARTYVETISTSSHGTQQIRTGARIPLAVADNQWQYMDVGVNFDVYDPREIGEKLAFNLNAEISSLAPPINGVASSASHPIVRQNRWSSNVVIVPGKPTVVFVADELDSKGKMEVEVTATRAE